MQYLPRQYEGFARDCVKMQRAYKQLLYNDMMQNDVVSPHHRLKIYRTLTQ